MKLAVVSLILLACAIAAVATLHAAAPPLAAGPPVPTRTGAPIGGKFPDENRIFASCPIAPWALPQHVKEHQV